MHAAQALVAQEVHGVVLRAAEDERLGDGAENHFPEDECQEEPGEAQLPRLEDGEAPGPLGFFQEFHLDGPEAEGNPDAGHVVVDLAVGVDEVAGGGVAGGQDFDGLFGGGGLVHADPRSRKARVTRSAAARLSA